MKRRLISELNARSYGSRITRLTALEGQINTVAASLFSEGVAKAKAAFGKAFTEGYFRTSYDLQCRSGFARDISGIDEKLIEDVLSYRYDGSDFSSRIWKNKNALALNLKNTLTDSLIRGKSAAETASALAKQTDVSFRSAARLVRTETNRFHNEGAMRAYAEAGIEYYEFVVTHDVRTCDECAALDGKRFRLDEKEPGVNFPPLHPNDRCTTVAYDPDWDDGKAKKELEGGYEEWKRRREEENGAGWVDKQRKKEYNKTADKEQYEKYKEVLGEDSPKTLGEFLQLKYENEDMFSFFKLDFKRRNRLRMHPELLLPNAYEATADDRKFTDYLFKPSSEKGYSKGKAFISRLGYNKNNYQEMKSEILKRASLYPTLYKGKDNFGKTYEQKIILYGNKGKPANVILGWKVEEGKTWLTSAYIKEVD